MKWSPTLINRIEEEPEKPTSGQWVRRKTEEK